MTKSFARSGVAVVALAGLLAAAPAMAFTHHPSTPAERAQTQQLNEQSLAAAQGQAPANQMAANATAPASTDMTTQPAQAPATTAPSDQQATPSTQQPAPA